MKSKSETDKRLARATKAMIERDLKAAQLYLGRPGSQSPGRPPKKSAIIKDGDV